MKKITFGLDKILLFIYILFWILFILVALRIVPSSESIAFEVFWPTTILFWIFTLICSLLYRKTGIIRTIATAVINLPLPIICAMGTQQTKAIIIIVLASLIIFVITLTTNIKASKYH